MFALNPITEVFDAGRDGLALNTKVPGHAKAESAESKMKDNLRSEKPICHNAKDRGSELGSGSDEYVKSTDVGDKNLQLRREYGTASVFVPRLGGEGQYRCIACNETGWGQQPRGV